MEEQILSFTEIIRDFDHEELSDLLLDIYQLGQYDSENDIDRSLTIALLPALDSQVAYNYISSLIDFYEDETNF